jgi:hypothetical protein
MFIESRRGTSELIDFIETTLDAVAFRVEGFGEAMATLRLTLSGMFGGARLASWVWPHLSLRPGWSG